MQKVKEYIKGKPEFSSCFVSEWDIDFEKSIKISYMIDFIKRKQIRSEFNYDFNDREIIPDGGMLLLINKMTNKTYPLVIAEIKRQGTYYQSSTFNLLLNVTLYN